MFPSGLSLHHPKMLPCLRRVLRPALSLRTRSGFTTSGLTDHQAPAVASVPWLLHRCHLGTHPPKDSVEPLNSPRGAKEFIYSLHPSERTCLLRELHRFESIAIAQGGSRQFSAPLELMPQRPQGQNQYGAAIISVCLFTCIEVAPSVILN